MVDFKFKGQMHFSKPHHIHVLKVHTDYHQYMFAENRKLFSAQNFKEKDCGLKQISL